MEMGDWLNDDLDEGEMSEFELRERWRRQEERIDATVDGAMGEEIIQLQQLIANLESEAKSHDESGDRLQKIILQHPQLSKKGKLEVTQLAAQCKKEASQIRRFIGKLNFP